jgi:amino acid transporter
MSLVAPQFRTPWFATALVGVMGAVLCLTVSLNTIITLTGATLVLNYAIVAVGALVGRATRATDHSPYRMPFWPLPPRCWRSRRSSTSPPSRRAPRSRSRVSRC